MRLRVKRVCGNGGLCSKCALQGKYRVGQIVELEKLTVVNDNYRTTIDESGRSNYLFSKSKNENPSRVQSWCSASSECDFRDSRGGYVVVDGRRSGSHPVYILEEAGCFELVRTWKKL